MLTYKQKFNLKYGFAKDQSHSIEEIARLTGYNEFHLNVIFKKGKGAFFTNPQSVRPNVKDPSHWGYSRVYSAVMGGKASKVDAVHLVRR